MAQVLHSVNRLLDLGFGNGSPGTLHVAAMFEPPEFTHEGADLDEPVGGGYSRVSVPNDVAHWPDAADGLKSNGEDIVFSTASDLWGTVRYWAILDAATGGNILAWGGGSSRLVTSGVTLRFTRDTLTITLR